ncbi:MAG: hypothetical protein ACJ74J_09425, partial [Blastocatellia bacterium]
ACFTFTTPGPNGTTITGGVTSVFALERGNPANRINANPFVVVNPNLIDAFFNFGSASAGKTFLIFVQGTGGTSRNRTAAQAGEPAGCALGNEQGVQVTFTCNSTTSGQAGAAVLTSYEFDAASNTITVRGSNIRDGAVVTVGGVTPNKVKQKGLETGSNTFTTLILRKGFCGALNGNAQIVVTNPGAAASNALVVTQHCQ